ncbi:phosphatidylglycerophosphatase A family protein [Candidatus Methylocalor cossyra]|uniref:Phosphatidylglycerophosphatase A n=1 Tax=Candidatus Methylocalor cossyra TaxID=3108543 RepID=A0ABM9NLE8_9GAMM
MSTSPDPGLAPDLLSRRPSFRWLVEDPRCLLAYGFGAGLAPVAPGTFGTLAAVPVYGLMSSLPLATYGALVAVLFLAGIPACRHAESRLGRRDPAGVVWDEMVGYWIAMALVPFSWNTAALGFLLFRLFDVLKPWPIGRLERALRGGLGIMLDDAVAGGLTAACLAALRAGGGL